MEGLDEKSLSESDLCNKWTLQKTLIKPHDIKELKEAVKMSVKVEPVSARSTALGEGPHWDRRTQTLYFVGIPDQTLHKYVPATGDHTKTKLERHSSIIIPVEGHLNHFVITQGREFVVVQWDGCEDSEVQLVKRLAEVDAPEPDSWINDGKVDSRGRLYAGTVPRVDLEVKNIDNLLESIPKGKGALYRFDHNGVSKVWDKISMANGLGWDEANKAMYYIDSIERNIRRYDYDVETGDISNLQYIFDFEKNGVTGLPDGMTVDADGNLWVASCNHGVTGSVIQVSPRGELLRQVSLPVSGVTSCTFGGPNLDILYVTTGSVNFGFPPEPLAGRTFKVTGLGVKGQVNNSFKL